MKPKLRLRSHYAFDKMAVGATKSIKIPDDDPRAGVRALCAAYAYARRNGWRFAGRAAVTRNGNAVMHIYRVG